jgi:hypothetical protein
MTKPTVITGDEMAAFTANLLALEACASCGGQPALILEHDTVRPEVLHSTDCADLLAADLDHQLHSILRGDQS